MDCGRGRSVTAVHQGRRVKGSVYKNGNKWVVQIERGRDADGNRLRDWLTTWLEGRSGIAETTRDGYQREVRRISDEIGGIRLRDLTAASVSQFYARLTRSGLSPKTVKNTHGVLHKAMADAVHKDVIRRNPAEYAELPPSETPELETWTAGQVRQFLETAESHRMYAAFMLLCSTGMRRSELLGLRWRSVDMGLGRLAIVDPVVPVRNKPTLRPGETKTKRSRRPITLDSRTLSVLGDHRKRQAEERLRTGATWEGLDLVFFDELGRVYDPNRLTRQFKETAASAGVPAPTPHSARHTWATLAISSGVHPKVVAERLGHSNVYTTLDRYSHVIDSMDKDAAEQVAALIH